MSAKAFQVLAERHLSAIAQGLVPNAQIALVVSIEGDPDADIVMFRHDARAKETLDALVRRMPTPPAASAGDEAESEAHVLVDDGLSATPLDMGSPAEAARILARLTAEWRELRQPFMGTAAEQKKRGIREHNVRFEVANAALNWLWHREHAASAGDEVEHAAERIWRYYETTIHGSPPASEFGAMPWAEKQKWLGYAEAALPDASREGR